MALTVGSGYLDSLARRRAQMEAARAGTTQASQMAVAGLDRANTDQKERARLSLAEQSEQRAADQAATQASIDRARLRLQQTAENRQAEGLRLEAEREARLAAADAAERERQAQADRYAEEKRGEDAAHRGMEAAVRARGGSLEPEEIAEIAEAAGVSEDEVRAASIAVAGEHRDKALSRESTEADIARKRAAARRGPSDPALAELRARKLAADTAVAEQRAGASAGGGITPAMRTKVQADAFESQQALAQSQSMRQLVQNTPGLEKMVGPVDGNLAALAGKAGLEDRHTMGALTTFRTHALMVRKALTGTAGSEKELAQIAQIVPNPGEDSVEQILGKLDAADRYFATRLDTARQMDEAGSIYGATPAGSGENIQPRGRDTSADDFFGVP